MLKFLPHSILLLIILSIAGMVSSGFWRIFSRAPCAFYKRLRCSFKIFMEAIEDDIENPELLMV